MFLAVKVFNCDVRAWLTVHGLGFSNKGFLSRSAGVPHPLNVSISALLSACSLMFLTLRYSAFPQG